MHLCKYAFILSLLISINLELKKIFIENHRETVQNLFCSHLRSKQIVVYFRFETFCNQFVF